MKPAAAIVAAIVAMAASRGEAATSPASDVERALFDLCPRVLGAELTIDDAVSMSGLGYAVEPADVEGLWASTRSGESRIRIGTEPGKPGCRVRYDGAGSERVYEAVLSSALRRGFRFAGGKRKPADVQFVIDTIAKDGGAIGVLSMFRVTSVPTQFAVTAFPPLPGR